MRRKRTLVIGQFPDPHIDAVCDQLNRLGSDTLVFDPFKRGHEIELSIGNDGPGGSIRGNGTSWPLESVAAVWWRWKPFSAAEWSGAFAKVAEEFASREWRAVLRSIPAFMPNARCVNPIAAHVQVAQKPWQMALASQLGFRLPGTQFTNRPQAVLKQFSSYGRVVYKTISSFLVPPNDFIFTNEIAERDVRGSFSSIRRAPGTFQQLVEKDHELRVTVVGNHVFPVRIDSQASAETSLDWRRDQFRGMYESVRLDRILEQKLLDFQSRAGLLFGAYDLIVPKDGEPFFLECNPGGQWLWLELELGIPISAAIAQLLAGDQ